MNLRNKFWFWSAALLIPMFLLGGISVWNLAVEGRAMRAATAEYEMTDRAVATAGEVGWLRDSLRGAGSAAYYDLKYFAPIQAHVDEIVQRIETAANVDDGDSLAELQLAREIPARLDKASSHISSTPHTPAASGEVATQLDQLRQSLSVASALGPEAARRHVVVAEAGIHSHMTWAFLWFSIALVLSASFHYKQYRLLVRPLLWLRDDMRRSAAGEYHEPVRARGDSEFKELAVYFNGLARELAELYRGLEEKVIARSRELVRSERLASVGFLAAGVAHEINNPLSVISGYAELSTKSMRRILSTASPLPPDDITAQNADSHAQSEAEVFSSVLEAQAIIREEAFRCKEITNRLLSLARGGTDNREPLALDEVAAQVAVLIKGLRNYRDRSVMLEFDTATSLDVIANLTEMKQVLLNLTVNALEASPASSGIVRISGQRSGEWIELFVEDNGKGMSQEILHQIFEPFYTAKRGAGEPGTGLGLSITHAIIENHGGRILAHSAGPGHGSRFTFRLPAAKHTTAHVPERALVTG